MHKGDNDTQFKYTAPYRKKTLIGLQESGKQIKCWCTYEKY